MSVEPGYDPKAADRYHSWLRGFKDAVAGRPNNPAFIEHERDEIRAAYARGMDDGVALASRAMARAQKRYGFTPSILRSGAPKTTEGR